MFGTSSIPVIKKRRLRPWCTDGRIAESSFGNKRLLFRHKNFLAVVRFFGPNASDILNVHRFFSFDWCATFSKSWLRPQCDRFSRVFCENWTWSSKRFLAVFYFWHFSDNRVAVWGSKCNKYHCRMSREVKVKSSNTLMIEMRPSLSVKCNIGF